MKALLLLILATGVCHVASAQVSSGAPSHRRLEQISESMKFDLDQGRTLGGNDPRIGLLANELNQLRPRLGRESFSVPEGDRDSGKPDRGNVFKPSDQVLRDLNLVLEPKMNAIEVEKQKRERVSGKKEDDERERKEREQREKVAAEHAKEAEELRVRSDRAKRLESEIDADYAAGRTGAAQKKERQYMEDMAPSPKGAPKPAGVE